MEAVHFKLFNFKHKKPTSAHWLFISHFTEQTLWQANKLSANKKKFSRFYETWRFMSTQPFPSQWIYNIPLNPVFRYILILYFHVHLYLQLFSSHHVFRLTLCTYFFSLPCPLPLTLDVITLITYGKDHKY